MSSVEVAQGHEVWGVVHRLDVKDLASLDASEGFCADRDPQKNGYNRTLVTVEMDGTPTEVHTYIAVATPNPLPPSEHYLTLIRNGAKQHGLPEAYQLLLAAL